MEGRFLKLRKQFKAKSCWKIRFDFKLIVQLVLSKASLQQDVKVFCIHLSSLSLKDNFNSIDSLISFTSLSLKLTLPVSEGQIQTSCQKNNLCVFSKNVWTTLGQSASIQPVSSHNVLHILKHKQRLQSYAPLTLYKPWKWKWLPAYFRLIL